MSCGRVCKEIIQRIKMLVKKKGGIERARERDKKTDRNYGLVSAVKKTKRKEVKLEKKNELE